MGLSSIVSLIGTAIGFLAILISLLKKRGGFFRKNTFLIMLICLTYYCFMVFLTDSGKIFDNPHFFKTGSPFFYLLPIAILWVGQSYLIEKQKLTRVDYAFLTIPLIHVVEYLPFFFQSSKKKSQYIQQLFEDRDQIIYASEGWIPTSYHFVIQLGFGLAVAIYLLLKVNNPLIKSQLSPSVFSWLNALSLVFFLFYLSGFGLLAFDSDELPIHELACWLFGLMLLAQLFFIFFRPEVLYDIKIQSKENKPPTSSLALEQGEAESYRQQIENYFDTHDDFLDTEFRQQHLANHLNIPKNQLSQIINHVFDQNFNQLINERRIQVAMGKLKTDEWKNLTMDGIAHEIGFKSRTTFYKAFHEKTGITPSQFRKQS